MKKKPFLYNFCVLGGATHLLIRTEADLRHLTELSLTHWALTLIRTDSVICDKRFVDILDSDKSGKIRADEVRETLKWMISHLTDLSGTVERSDRLKLSALNLENPEAAEMYQTIKIALQNLKKDDQDYITLAQISDNSKIVQNTLQNGDGVIPPDQIEGELVCDCIRSIMALVGSHKDLSGLDGVNADDVKAFQSLATGYLAWKKFFDDNQDTLMPYGDKTAALYQAMVPVRDKVDEFFQSVNTLKFGDLKVANEAVAPEKLLPDSVHSFLEKSHIANPVLTSVISCNDNVNPLWRDSLKKLFCAYNDATGSKLEYFDEAEWLKLKGALAPYGNWLNSKNTSIFDNFDFAKLCKYEAEKCYDTILSYSKSDVAVSHCLQLCDTVVKLIVLQMYMMDFVNNYVSLYNLFDEHSKSMIQKGKLVMDGRVFTLCTMVPNPAEHKKIVLDSDICVMYLDVYRSVDGNVKEQMKIAVAVTSGHVRNIFIGKAGVFLTPDGSVWTAQIFDFVKQPVSVSEAICEPFFKFRDFIQMQVDKFFNLRSKNFENKIATDITKNATPPAAPASAPQGGGMNPMLLMGGGIGLAAIGSSFAFITKSLQGVSLGMILAVLLGIMLIFGAPILISALVKLFRRDLSRFFEANGYAVNNRMRLSLKLGRLFTYVPKINRHIDLLYAVLPREDEEESHFWRNFLLTILAIAVLGYLGYRFWPILSHWFTMLLNCLHG